MVATCWKMNVPIRVAINTRAHRSGIEVAQRKRVLRACIAGGMTRKEAQTTFGVDWATAWRASK